MQHVEPMPLNHHRQQHPLRPVASKLRASSRTRGEHAPHPAIPAWRTQAWILPALTRPERAPLYYSLAALYAVPLLRNGFDFDAYVWTMYALMIVHVQVRGGGAQGPRSSHVCAACVACGACVACCSTHAQGSPCMAHDHTMCLVERERGRG